MLHQRTIKYNDHPGNNDSESHYCDPGPRHNPGEECDRSEKPNEYVRNLKTTLSKVTEGGGGFCYLIDRFSRVVSLMPTHRHQCYLSEKRYLHRPSNFVAQYGLNDTARSVQGPEGRPQNYG